MNRHFRAPALSALLALALGTLALPGTARADVTVSVGPSLVEISATPDGQGGQELTVSNRGSEPFPVAASIEPYRDAANQHSAVAWLAVSPQSFELGPGQQQRVNTTVTVPAGAGAGGYYAVVAFTTGARPTNGSGASVSGRVGVPFLISVQGQGSLNRRASLERIVPVLEADGRTGFRAMLNNGGNLHLVARGAVDVSRADGTPAGRLELPETTAILPETQRVLATQGSLPLAEGEGYAVRSTVEYGGDAPAVAEARFAARAGLSLVNPDVRENLDRGPTVRLGLRNDGELGLLPQVQLAIRRPDGTIVGTASPSEPPLVLPGQTTDVETDLPARLSSGEYVLLTRVGYGRGTPIEQETPFRIGNAMPTPNAAWGQSPPRAPEGRSGEIAGFPWAVLLPILTLLGLVAGVAWLPPLTPFRRRIGRAVGAFREGA